MYAKTLRKLFFLFSTSLLFAFASWSQATIITMDADGVAFEGNLLTGTNNIGVLFFHGRGANITGNYVKQVGQTLNSQGYTTFSLANPEPSTGTGFGDYLNEEEYVDDQVFARLNAALVEMSNAGVEHVVLSGISMGSRLMTAAAAAWELGIFNPSVNITLDGLIGVSMYADYGFIAGTVDNPTSYSDFNVYDTHKNLTFLDSIPVLDIYGSKDWPAVFAADTRLNAYGGSANMYIQQKISCPPNNGTYYAWLGGTNYVPYYGVDGMDVNRCHQVRDGYLKDENGNYYLDFRVRGTIDAPVDSSILAFMESHVIPHTQVPEPSSLLLMLFGIPMLLVSIRKRKI